jgi:hypothetical protein
MVERVVHVAAAPGGGQQTCPLELHQVRGCLGCADVPDAREFAGRVRAAGQAASYAQTHRVVEGVHPLLHGIQRGDVLRSGSEVHLVLQHRAPPGCVHDQDGRAWIDVFLFAPGPNR